MPSPFVKRFDSGRLGKVARTPQGGIRVDASVTRSGIFVYKNPDGSERREYRPDSEVFAEDSLATLDGAPVTNLHPPEMVGPQNYTSVVVGHAATSPKREDSLVVTKLAIQDGYAIDLINTGDRNEISCGYLCELDNTPGTTPNGERYDAIQRKIVYNHIALVPKGRAGSSVSLRLDSDLNELIELDTPKQGNKGKTKMEFELIEGIKYEVGSEAHSAAQARRDAESAKTAKAFDALVKERDELKARADAFDATLAQKVSDKIALLEKAKGFGVEARADMSEEDIQKAILTKALPRVDLEGKSAAYIEAALDLLGEDSKPNAGDVRVDALPSPNRVETPAEAPDVIARKAMVQRLKKH